MSKITTSQQSENKRKRYATYLPDDVIEQIRRAAHNLHLTTGEVVEIAVVEFIDKEEAKRGQKFAPITRLRSGRPLRD